MLLDRRQLFRDDEAEALARHNERRFDARADTASCFTISDKALAIGGGVLVAILTHLNHEIDYEDLRRRCPPGVEPGYDGLTLEV